MITLRHIIYHSNDDPEALFTRLSNKTERTQNLFWQLSSKRTFDTSKIWIGVCDREKMEFKVAEPTKFLNPRWLQATAHGEIIKSSGKVIVNVKLKATLYSLIFWCLIYTVAGVKVLDYFFYEKTEDPTNLLLLLFFGPVLGTCLIILKLNSLETDLEDTMGIR